jgi:hypothetical protein
MTGTLFYKKQVVQYIAANIEVIYTIVLMK